MSQTFHLVCHETKQEVWVGQGHGGVMTSFYSAQSKTMAALARFLAATAGKALVLMEADQLCDFDDAYEEFEEGPDDVG